MCGQFCTMCGACGKDVGTSRLSISNVPGYCAQCGFLNSMTATTCMRCGAAIQSNVGAGARPTVR